MTRIKKKCLLKSKYGIYLKNRPEKRRISYSNYRYIVAIRNEQSLLSIPSHEPDELTRKKFKLPRFFATGAEKRQ